MGAARLGAGKWAGVPRTPQLPLLSASFFAQALAAADEDPIMGERSPRWSISLGIQSGVFLKAVPILRALVAGSILLSVGACSAQQAASIDDTAAPGPSASETSARDAAPESSEAPARDVAPESSELATEAPHQGPLYAIGPEASPAGIQACEGLGIGELLLEGIGPSTLKLAETNEVTVTCLFEIPTETTDGYALNWVEFVHEKEPVTSYDGWIERVPGGTELSLGDRAYHGSMSDEGLNLRSSLIAAEIDGELFRLTSDFEPINVPENWNADIQEEILKKAIDSLTP